MAMISNWNQGFHKVWNYNFAHLGVATENTHYGVVPL